MDIQKPDWRKIELCRYFLDILDCSMDEISSLQKSDNKEYVQYLLAKYKDLEAFYKMVFNVAFYEFALAYSEVQEASNKIIEDYLKKKSDGMFGGKDEQTI